MEEVSRCEQAANARAAESPRSVGGGPGYCGRGGVVVSINSAQPAGSSRQLSAFVFLAVLRSEEERQAAVAARRRGNGSECPTRPLLLLIVGGAHVLVKGMGPALLSREAQRCFLASQGRDGAALAGKRDPQDHCTDRCGRGYPGFRPGVPRPRIRPCQRHRPRRPASAGRQGGAQGPGSRARADGARVVLHHPRLKHLPHDDARRRRRREVRSGLPRRLDRRDRSPGPVSRRGHAAPLRR